MTDSKKILLVADYGKDDLAFYEVVQKLHQLAGKEKLEIEIVSASSFNVPETAALIAEGVESGKYDLVYHNTAPRLDGKPKEGNAGEGLAYTRVRNKSGKEVQIIGVASGNEEVGNAFSLVTEEHLEVLYPLTNVDFAETGSQFRSRDAFPQEVIKVLTTAEQENNSLRETITVDELPPQQEETAKKAIEGRLHEAQTNGFIAAGNAQQSYITIFGLRDRAAELIKRVKEQNPDAYIDFLPVDRVENDHNAQKHTASHKATQLAANADFSGNRAVVIAVTDDDVDHFLDRRRNTYIAELESGARIISPDEYAFSFANLPVHDDGSGVIRNFSKTLVKSVFAPDANIALIANKADIAIIPDVDQNRVITDGYGNIKTARIFDHHQKSGSQITIRANRQEISSQTITDTSFDSSRGQVNVAKGSTGWGANFAEIWIRNDDASAALGGIKPGQKVEIEGFDLKATARELYRQASQTIQIAA